MDGAHLTDRAARPEVASHGGRARPFQPAKAGRAGSDDSGRTVLAFRLEVRHRRVERGERDGGNRRSARHGRQCRHHRGCVTSAGAEVAAVSLGAIVTTCGVPVGMSMVCVCVSAVRVVAALHAMVCMTDSDREFTRLAGLCAQHGRANCAPEGEQHANQQQNEDAKSSHLGKLSRAWSRRDVGGRSSRACEWQSSCQLAVCRTWA